MKQQTENVTEKSYLKEAILLFILMQLIAWLATGCISYKCNQTTFNAEAAAGITQTTSGAATLDAATDISPKLTAEDNTIPIR